MATQIQPISYFVDIFRNTMLADAGRLTDFSPGSINDIISGAVALLTNELQEHLIAEIRKTYFDSSTGDNLDALAQDHFGFSRPGPTASSVELTFERVDADAGAVTIPANTQASTDSDDAGATVSFLTVQDLVFGATEKVLTVRATSAGTGTGQNVGAGTVSNIDSDLPDTFTVTNTLAASGAKDTETDAEYRETIKRLLSALAGATKEALRATLLAIPGITQAVVLEHNRTVIDYDIASGAIKMQDGENLPFFRLNVPVAYVAGTGGTLSDEIVREAQAEIDAVRACGVSVSVISAVPFPIPVAGSIVRNVESSFNDAQILQQVANTIQEYLNQVLEIGQDLVVTELISYVNNTWGTGGTQDITSFTVSSPAVTQSASEGQKIISSTVTLNMVEFFGG